MKVCIWRDQHDSDQYYLGARRLIKDNKNYIYTYRLNYTIYAPIFVDGLYEVLGLEKRDVEMISTIPVEIDIKAKIL
jgi:hypothetical protein